MNKTPYLGAVAAALFAPSSFAALSITNGDFESGIADETNQHDVSGWFSVITGDFFANAWQTSSDSIVPNDAESGGAGEAGVVFSDFNATTDVNAGSFLYQSIGSMAGATSVPIDFLWGSPQDANTNRELGLTVAIYESTGGFTPANGIDVRGAADVTLLDSANFGRVFADAETTSDGAILDVSGQSGGELFLRFNNYDPALGDPAADDSWVYLDNVVIPEPSIALLGGLGVLGLLRRRRA